MISGKNIVLTGANSGIGLAMLRSLAESNKILAVDMNDDKMSQFGNVTSMVCDISSKEGVDSMFSKASDMFDVVDIFIANAGYMHFERMDGCEWERIDRMFRTNTMSPIYSYRRYIEHLDGRDGVFAMTISAMGRLGMPGFTLYSSTKFALNGFQEAVRLEKPDNVQITCMYPVSTDTAFFDSPVEIEKPYPVQTPEHVAGKMLRGIEKGKKNVFPCKMFTFASILFKAVPPVKWMYWKNEKKKFLRYEERLNERK